VLVENRGLERKYTDPWLDKRTERLLAKRNRHGRWIQYLLHRKYIPRTREDKTELPK